MIIVRPLLLSPNAVCLVFEGLGPSQAHSLILGFSQWYLVLQELLVVPLITSSEVRN